MSFSKSTPLFLHTNLQREKKTKNLLVNIFHKQSEKYSRIYQIKIIIEEEDNFAFNFSDNFFDFL